MIFNYDNYVKAIWDELLKKPNEVWISSFGCNTGVSGRGGTYTYSQTFKMVDWINRNTKSSRILIGTPTHSVDSYLNRLTFNAEYFGNIRWRYELDIHLKCWIFHFDKTISALVGGRNLGDSGWSDISLFTTKTEAKQLARFYNKLWTSTKPVRKETPLRLIHKGKVVTQ